MSPEKILSATEQQTGSLATLQHFLLLDRVCAPLQRTQDCYETDFDARLREGLEIIRTDDYVLIDVSNGVTKTPKLEHGVEGPYCVLGQNQHTVAIQRKELVERITADRIVLAPRRACVPPILPTSDSAMDLQNKNFERTPRLLHGFLNNCLKHDGQLEVQLN